MFVPGADMPMTPELRMARIETVLRAAGESEHYRVLAEVGAGGIGVVYKALDTELNRAVAIKAINALRLPEARFTERLHAEALAAASLDHPYICKIYELIDSGAEKLIVMEFVEGETLGAILSRGLPPLMTTLGLAVEIAEGLANAHERGLVHRDLKPANIMVTPHGHIKLLDFGLMVPDASGEATVERRKAASTETFAGTPYYMSPEQALGQPVTPRTDLFSFGVVLFQSVTGRLPFTGDSAYEYVNRLVSGQAAPVRQFAPDVPVRLARLIDRCLERTPERRPASAQAIVQELRAVLDESRPAETDRRGRAPALLGWAVPVAIAGALAAIGTYGWRAAPAAPAAIDPVPRSVPFLTSSNEESDSRISPDGQWVSFLSMVGNEKRVMVKPVEGGEAQAVELPAGHVMSQLWSPDGRQLAFVLRREADAVLQVVPAFFGGAVQRTVPIQPTPNTVRLLRWIGQTIFMQVSDGRRWLQRVDLATGESTDVSRTWNLAGTLRTVDVTPDGTRVAFTMVTPGGQEDLWIANLDGTSATQITDDGFFERLPLWSNRGSRVIYQSNAGGQIDLWEIDPETRRSRPLTSSQTEEEPESASADGSLVSFLQLSQDSDLWRWDAPRAATRLTDDALSDFAPTMAAGGSGVGFQRNRPSPLVGDPEDSTLFLGSFDGAEFRSRPVQVEGFAPRLSPDGTRLAYMQRGQGNAVLGNLALRDLRTQESVVISSTAARPAYSTVPVEWAGPNVVWAPSSTELYFVDRADGAALRRYRIGASAPDAPLAVAAEGERLTDLHVSPGGQALAFLTVSGSPVVSNVHRVDLATGVDRIVATIEGPASLRGWFPGRDALVLLRQNTVHADRTSDVDVVMAPVEGPVQPLGRIDRVFIPTTRLDPARPVLYVTRSEGGVHNLYTLNLGTGRLARLTDNTSSGVSFSGMETTGGAIIGVRTERRSDVWLMDLRENAGADAGSTPR